MLSINHDPGVRGDERSRLSPDRPDKVKRGSPVGRRECGLWEIPVHLHYEAPARDIRSDRVKECGVWEIPVHHYEILAREIRSECVQELLDGPARKACRFTKEFVVSAFAGIKRRRAIASTAKALFVLDDSILRDIGIERNEIWSVAVAAVDGAAVPKRFKEVLRIVATQTGGTATGDNSIPMAA